MDKYLLEKDDLRLLSEEELKKLEIKLKSRLNEIQLLMPSGKGIFLTLSGNVLTDEELIDPIIVEGFKDGFTGEISLKLTQDGFMELPLELRNNLGEGIVNQSLPLPIDEALSQALAHAMGLENSEQFNQFFRVAMSNETFKANSMLNEMRTAGVEKLKENLKGVEIMKIAEGQDDYIKPKRTPKVGELTDARKFSFDPN